MSTFTPHVVRTSGVYLYTDDGREIIDAAGGALVTNIGHGRGEVVDAVAAAMRTVDYVLPTWSTPGRVALRDRLVNDWLPDGHDYVFFASGGSEANDSAMRLARQHHVASGQPGKWKVIGRDPSFHGSTMATLSAGMHRQRRHGLDPMLSEWPKVPWNEAGALAGVIEAAGPDSVAAFIGEPIIGAAGGALTAGADYWAEIAAVCAHYNVLTISDEVMCGFGRTGKRWGFEHDGWTPDIIVSAKGLGGGYVPLSMVSAHGRLVEPIHAAGERVMFFTYSAHDSACAGAMAVLDVIDREQLVERAARVGALLSALLHERFESHPRVSEVRGRGLFLGLGLREVTALRVVEEAMARDIWIYPAGSGAATGDAVLVAPPLIIDEALLPAIVERVAAAIDAA